MKPFDLEAAKRGDPIITRDGRKAWFIGVAPEEAGSYYSVFAWIKGQTKAGNFSVKGQSFESGPCGDDDLFMDITNPITINGKKLEGPIIVEPAEGTWLWLLYGSSTSPVQWDRLEEADYGWFRSGRLFRTREARDAMQAEIVKLLRGEA